MPWTTMPPGAGWTACEGIIRRFEQAWQAGERPDLAGFLSDGPHRQRLLQELVNIELEFRLRAGEWARVEEYVARFPELDTQEALLDLITNEYTLRQRFQESPWPDEYYLRFPVQIPHLPARLSFASSGPPLSEPVHKPEVTGYEILDQLGKGGMGVVWKARHLELGRVVAIKTLRHGVASSPDERARFRREAEALARLDHPNVAPVLEVGESGGIAYFVMKLYTGGSLARDPAGAAFDPRRAAAVVETIARGVHHAHQRGILHRDLKPSNILLDADGEPHIADFGLARLDDGTGATTGPIGTPSYMAPEQARDPAGVSVSADVWGLGVILYELLAGRPPFLGPTAMAVLEQAANAPPESPRKLNPAVPRDLETVCLRCLEKDPKSRYESAAALAEDLRRWREGEPVVARPAGKAELAWRWARKHPVVAAMSGLTTAAVAASVVILAVSYDQLARKENETQCLLSRERETSEKLARSLDQETRRGYLERVALAGRLWTSNQTTRASSLLDHAPESLRDWEWRYLDGIRRCAAEPIRAHSDWVGALASSPSGRLIASGSRDGLVVLTDVATRKARRSWQAHSGPALSAAFALDETWLATASHPSVKVWNLATGELMKELPGGYWLALSPDGKQLATTILDTITIYDVASWAATHSIKGHKGPVFSGAFHPSGKELASCSVDNTVRRWDLTTGKQVGSEWRRQGQTTKVAYALGGRLLVEASRRLRIGDAVTGQLTSMLGSLGSSPSHFSVSADGRLVAFLDRDQTVRVRDLEGVADLAVFRGHSTDTARVAFVGNGRAARPWVASSDAEGCLRLWDVGQEDMRTLAMTGEWVGGLAFDATGRRVAYTHRQGKGATAEGEVRVVDVEGRPVATLKGWGDVAFGPNGELAAGHRSEGAVVWDLASAKMLRNVQLKGRDFCTRIRYGVGGRLVIGTVSGCLHVAGEKSRSWSVCSREVEGLATHPTEPLAATASNYGPVVVWNLDDGTKVRVLPGGPASAVAFSPDGTRLLVAHTDRVVRLWEWRFRREEQTFLGHGQPVTDVAYHKGGRRVATASSDGTVRVWDVESGYELLSLPGLTGAVSRLAWSHDGDRLVAVDTALRLWDAGPR